MERYANLTEVEALTLARAKARGLAGWFDLYPTPGAKDIQETTAEILALVKRADEARPPPDPRLGLSINIGNALDDLDDIYPTKN